MKAGCEGCQGNTKGVRRRCVHCNRNLCSRCKPWKEWCRDCAPRRQVGEVVRLRVGNSEVLTEEYGEILERLPGDVARVCWVDGRVRVHLEESLVTV